MVTTERQFRTVRLTVLCMAAVAALFLVTGCARPNAGGDLGAPTGSEWATSPHVRSATPTPADVGAIPATILRRALLPSGTTPGFTLVESGAGDAPVRRTPVLTGWPGTFEAGDPACRHLLDDHGYVAAAYAFQALTSPRPTLLVEVVESYPSEAAARELLEHIVTAVRGCKQFTIGHEGSALPLSYGLVHLSGPTSGTEMLLHLLEARGDYDGLLIRVTQLRIGPEILLFSTSSMGTDVPYEKEAQDWFAEVVGDYRAQLLLG